MSYYQWLYLVVTNVYLDNTRVGTVNSLHLKNPKNAKAQAAHIIMLS